ncbi:MAG: MOSC domain-containing protein [Candidatus Omnitrophica bacterium]|nr:MOSC domain-containing protein [Candidatus Omnitrophota bacterium]
MREPVQFPQVVAVCVSGGGIPKIPQASVPVMFAGLAGDGHNHAKHNTPLQAVCLQDEEILKQLGREGFSLDCGAIGENMTVRNLDVQKLPVGTVLEFSGGVVLELTKERKPCYVLDAIDPRLKEVIAGRCGFYAKVLREGSIQAGESIQVKEMAVC